MPAPETLAFRKWLFDVRDARIAELDIARATTYYIAANGNDAAAGTKAAPWLTTAKVQAIITANPTGNIAFLFRAGDTWVYDGANNLGLIVTSPNVTIGIYDYTGNAANRPPLFTRFYKKYAAAAFAVDGTYTNCYSVAETANISAVRYQNDVWAPTTEWTIFRKYATATALNAALYPGFFWDSSGHKLYVNTKGVDITSGTWPARLMEGADGQALVSRTCGIKITADGCVVKDVRVDGYTLSDADANVGGGAYPIYFCPAVNNYQCLVMRCQAYYGNWHMIGMANDNAAIGGGSFTCIDNEVGLAYGTVANAPTMFVAYLHEGAFEAIFWGNKVHFGCLPVTGDTWYPVGTDFFGHTGDTAKKIGLIIDAYNVTDDGLYDCGNSHFYSPDYFPAPATTSDSRLFIFNNTLANSYAAIDHACSFLGGMPGITANNVANIITSGTNQNHLSAGTLDGTTKSWTWNNKVTVDFSSNARGSYMDLFTGSPGVSTWLHNLIVAKAVGSYCQMDNMLNVGGGNGRFANNIISYYMNYGEANVFNTQAAGTLYNNAYSGIAINGSDSGAIQTTPTAAEALVRTVGDGLTGAGKASPFSVVLEYDANWCVRPVAPSIGPYELAEDVQLSPTDVAAAVWVYGNRTLKAV